MAASGVEPEPEWSDRALDTAEDTLVAIETLLATLRAFEDVLKQQEISELSSAEYCDNFCQALIHYAGNRNSIEHGLPLLEVYCLSINCFAEARSHLTAESDKVALVLKRLALSCFELLLSVPENDIPYEAWVQFHSSVQCAHNSLSRYGSTDLQALLQITGEGGAWSNPVISSLLTGQPTATEAVNEYISLEGEGFMEMRVKHLEKMGEVAKAVVLAKACTECSSISNQATFRQTYMSLLCHLLPSEEAIMEISRLDSKDVLETTSTLETEGEENTAFILCTTFLTQQLQHQTLHCSWDLIQLWCKLQRRLDPSLLSLLERCLQLGAIAKTVQHLLYLVRVIQAETGDHGVPASVELCVKALQLPKQDDSETRISVCKTLSCLLLDDLEVLRACKLTEYLLGPNKEAFASLKELYSRPDQKYDQENEVIPNSLRCELLLALKAYWPFDPEFWDWNTLKYHCITLFGLVHDLEGDDNEEKVEHQPQQFTVKVEHEHENRINGDFSGSQQPVTSSETQAELEVKQHKFACQICKRVFSDTHIIHHSKRHAEDGHHPCPLCLKNFENRQKLIMHLNQHLRGEIQPHTNSLERENDQNQVDEDDDVEPGEITVDPSLMLYYKSTHDPDVLQHIVQQAKTVKEKRVDDDEHITFDYITQQFTLQNRDEYPCPGTGCTRIFKHSKYLYVHLKSDHDGDENVKHFQEMRDRREKCLFCKRHFVSHYHHRKHRRVHFGDRPYLCVVIGCGAQFKTSNELIMHKQTHGYQVSYQCELQGCSVTCSDLGQVYHHEAQHFREAAFTCTSGECKKFYLSKKEFITHLSTHNITFSEEDFDAQTKAKRKLYKALPDGPPRIKKCVDSNEVMNGLVLNSATVSSVSSSQECNKEPKATMTLVAVCFDGSKFTCGFEKCGMTFSRTRDVQRHLKGAHAEYLKLENREHELEKEVKTELDPEDEEKRIVQIFTPCPPTQTCKEAAAPIRPDEANSISNLHTSDEALKDILNRLSKLDINCSFPNLARSESNPQSDALIVALHQAIIAKPPVHQINSAPLPENNIEIKTEQGSTVEGVDIEALATAKPYVCQMKSCDFRTAQSYSLQRHYCTRHGRTMEQAKRMTSLKATSFKPYHCQLCSKSHRQKNVLRAHYIHVHKLSKRLVDRLSYGSIQDKGKKIGEENSSKLSASQDIRVLDKSFTDVPDHTEEENSPVSRENGKNCESLFKEEEPENETEIKKEENETNGECEKTTQQIRSTRRLVARSNHCYVLDKFNKPYHCVAKNCDAAFSTQGGLVRHLQLVHHYKRSQLLLEKDIEVNDSHEVRKEPVKKRLSPNSDEPQPRFKCHFAKCSATYHLKSSLLRHMRDIHSQPTQILKCKYEGCRRIFTQNYALEKHTLYDHCDYYDSLVVRLQSTHKKSVTGCQKKLIITPSSQNTEPNSETSQNGRSSPEPGLDSKSEETCKLDEEDKNMSVVKSKPKRNTLSSFVLRSHEEALQMCQDRCMRVAYPCMVQDCDSVVSYVHSLNRHYIKVHRMRREDIYKSKLVFNAEQLEELIQKTSARPTMEEDDPTKSISKIDNPLEPEIEEEEPTTTSLQSIESETQVGKDSQTQELPQDSDKEQPTVERVGVLVGADEVLCEPSAGNHAEDTLPSLPEVLNQEEKHNFDKIKQLLRPLSVDLSPACSLRPTIDQASQDPLINKDGGPKINGSATNPSSPVRQPLTHKNELPEHPSNVKESQGCNPPNPFNIAAYKPIGFEASFLEFIQDTSPKEKNTEKCKDTFRRSCSVKENNQLGISHSCNKRTHSPLPKSHISTRIQNLKSILDKALAGCGDLAIKQLQYLRPVVVLGRPVSPTTTLSDLFPSDNSSKLLLGS